MPPRHLLLSGLLAVAVASVSLAARQTPAPAPKEQQPASPPAQGQPAAQPATDQAAPPPQPTFRAGINLVRVDCIVTDKKGQPVMDLKEGDFQVWEDGAAQEITSFKLFKIDALNQTTPARPIRTTFDEESEAQRTDVRLFSFFLDDYHVRRGNAMRARIDLANFVRNEVAPQDMVSIMYPLEPLDAVVLSRDHENLARALEKFDGRKYDYTPRNQYEDEIASYPTQTIEQVRLDVSLSALKALIIRLGGLREGKKALVLVSEGYSNYIPPQMQSSNGLVKGLNNPAANNPFAGDSQQQQTLRFFGEAEMMGRLKDVFDLANRYNVSIYALDPRGLAAFEQDIDEGGAGISLTTDKEMLRMTLTSLQVLADNTDGRAIVNKNDLAAGMRQILRDQSAYYLLGYNSSKAPVDGKFHEIKVKVKRPGLDVRARKGYVAFNPEDLKKALAPSKDDRPKDVDLALASIVTPAARGDFIHSWMGMSRGSNGKTKVTYVWEPATPGTAHQTASHVQLTVIGPDGTPYFRGSSPQAGSAPSTGMIDISGPTTPAQSAAAVARAGRVVTFEVPPGPVQMKVRVQDAGDMELDSDSRQFFAPDLTTPDVRLSTPAVFRARTGPEAEKIVSDPNAVPAIAREFRRTERLVVRAQAYGPGTEIPDVTARILNRSGDKVEDLPFTPQPTTGIVNVPVPLANLAPGEYLVELKAKGKGGEAKQLVAFRVTS
jgi:VWFA-related protein